MNAQILQVCSSSRLYSLHQQCGCIRRFVILQSIEIAHKGWGYFSMLEWFLHRTLLPLEEMCWNLRWWCSSIYWLQVGSCKMNQEQSAKCWMDALFSRQRGCCRKKTVARTARRILQISTFWLQCTKCIQQFQSLIKVPKKRIPFATTLLCEAGFSAMCALKTKHRNWLKCIENQSIEIDEAELRLSLSDVSPQFQKLTDS